MLPRPTRSSLLASRKMEVENLTSAAGFVIVLGPCYLLWSFLSAAGASPQAAVAVALVVSCVAMDSFCF